MSATVHSARVTAGATLLLFAALPGSAYAAPPALAENGGFEAPALDPGTWSVFPSVPGWAEAGAACGIEVQNNVSGSPHSGAQFVELDSHCSTGISQTVPTAAGRYYTLTYAFSARPGVAENILKTTWGQQALPIRTADGSGISDTRWEVFTEKVRAEADGTVLTFRDDSESDSYGTYLDSVSVTAAQPQTKDDCRNDGWTAYADADGNPFKNQGDCVSYLATQGRNPAG